ncbi:3-hydroxyacyl-ACP dehydratase FabZ [Kangiella spongicola]|jgi:3-hydroxyacyl-[acyl-carrier-protein] dehydratase|uniref:3-hydroxyacyl-[acyl-carrier-protein] dehydratase FabZ n=1 Tax=Kangiella spongicola TaxID=796379 RepID=A0A318D220_9GAMM|nr:3-hydroxyacyl-[acyl-carrier-protein] dehydratase FabZ [Rickettsiales bacterium]PXF63200.1 3-hydroxyacyl-[acyl-carrier-protein] dehydratase FabZ [Kangiella spongicola]
MSDNKQPNELNSMDIYEVMQHLPHRYPFLLIDRVLDYTAGEKLTAIKNVTVNEPFFPGHFPHRPVFPGVLMLEALAQATGILAFKTTEDLPSEDSLYYFVGIDNARFKKPVEPGDQLLMEVEVIKRKRDMWKFKAQATVDGKVVCSAELMCARKDIA